MKMKQSKKGEQEMEKEEKINNKLTIKKLLLNHKYRK